MSYSLLLFLRGHPFVLSLQSTGRDAVWIKRPGSLLSGTLKTTHKNIDYFMGSRVIVLTFISKMAVSGHVSPVSFARQTNFSRCRKYLSMYSHQRAKRVC